MDKQSDSGRPRIDAAVKARFVAALRAGTPRKDAAAAEGFSLEAFYCARKRDALFRSAWIWGMELRLAEEREARRAAEMAAAAEGLEIAPNNRRLLQRRRGRGNRFTDRRKQLFLDHFAATADIEAAALAAGVHPSTVYKHRRADPVFAAGWDEALRTVYALLEAEAARQRLAALRRAAFEPFPSPEAALEFERVVKLLARLDRQGVRGVREVGRGAERRWSFDEAITLLDKKLRALGARHGIAGEPTCPPPPEQEAE